MPFVSVDDGDGDINSGWWEAVFYSGSPFHEGDASGPEILLDTKLPELVIILDPVGVQVRD